MLSELQEKKLTRYFQVYDIDDNGRIAASDLERVVENVRVLQGAAEGSFAEQGLRSSIMTFWSALSGSADVDQDGEIDLDEWLAYWQVALESDLRYAEEVEEITVDAGTFNAAGAPILFAKLAKIVLFDARFSVILTFFLLLGILLLDFRRLSSTLIALLKGTGLFV